MSNATEYETCRGISIVKPRDLSGKLDPDEMATEATQPEVVR